MKRIILLVSMMAMLAMLAAPALAQGQVERGPAHANSICSFSGLNDEPDDPLEGGRVQSYGQIVKAGGKAFAPSPGTLCNGHLFPYPEAFEEEAP
jgi:poly(3-hydroxybutyrate) depolymerase